MLTRETCSVEFVYHFSEDASIERFVPHVPPTNPTQRAAVWAIDAQHAPLYGFPRDCPRVTAWPREDAERELFEATFHTTARRVHAVELGWLDRIRSVELFRYSFDGDLFRQRTMASGQWVSHAMVEPIDVEPVGDLLDAHADAVIELRAVPSLWPLHDLVQSDRWDFSIVRMHNADART